MRGFLAAGTVAVLALALPGLARAESCAFDPVSKTVSATVTPGGTAVLDVAGGQIRFGAVPTPCGSATTANTDSISIAGSVGTTEQLTLDQREGFFGPGATAESNLPEIEIATALGDATDRVVVYGTNGADYMAAGQNGLATSSDGDVDVTFAPGAFALEVHLLEGDDYFNGRGESGGGLHFLGPIVMTGGPGNETLLRGSSEPDSIEGGPGNDELRGQEANDALEGGEGNDILAGGGENDTMIGGPGLDRLIGSSGDDTMFAHDDEADPEINGGPGFDVAHVDVLDPVPLATEIVIRPSESCTYDGTSRALALTMTPASTATLVLVNGEIWWGEVPQQCGAATATNTDSISIKGAVGTSETLVLDQRGGFFGPGATPESNTPEIEITTELGDTSDRVIVYGTEGADFTAAGQNGFATSSDGDVDVTFAPNTFRLEVHLLGGNDHFDARGTGGAGLHFLGPIAATGGDGNETLIRGGSDVDSLDGGPGNDVVEGQEGADVLRGGPGNDSLTGGGGGDSIEGGPGVDVFNGNDGDDMFLAQDDEADASLSGGPGSDTAYVDTGVDPAPVAVETVIGDGSPPPPTVTGCTYDAAKRAITATLTAGGEATLAVAGGEIRFGATPVACGAATTANTDSIAVSGAGGSNETLTIDQSGGAFAPGATGETGTAEIEIAVNLGDATDAVVVLGTPGNDAIAAGTSGVALNADGDVDVTFSPLPAVLTIRGREGTNAITGQGTQGAGGRFTGRLLLYAGDEGDTLTGGDGADELFGGAGPDSLEGRFGSDLLAGGAAGDSLSGGDGNDNLHGGTGSDAFIAGGGDDFLDAVDGEAESNLNGGPGVDTARYDAAIDPAPVAVENHLPE
ncbi:MAG: calcium-binding protein [Gaiellaceae bacterium]